MALVRASRRRLARRAGGSGRPPLLARGAVAAVWLYEGGWRKLLARSEHEAAVVAGVPGLGPRGAPAALGAIGAVEVAIAAWVLSGRAPVPAAVAQTGLLVGLNAGGLRWGRDHIDDPAGMIVRNAAFLCLVWWTALVRPDDARR